MDWRDRITTDPLVCHGKPCVKGTRVLVEVVLANLASGVAIDRILKAYPPLTEEDVRACLGYATELARGSWSNLPDRHP